MSASLLGNFIIFCLYNAQIETADQEVFIDLFMIGRFYRIRTMNAVIVMHDARGDGLCCCSSVPKIFLVLDWDRLIVSCMVLVEVWPEKRRYDIF
jgi:hypothetical protein